MEIKITKETLQGIRFTANAVLQALYVYEAIAAEDNGRLHEAANYKTTVVKGLSDLVGFLQLGSPVDDDFNELFNEEDDYGLVIVPLMSAIANTQGEPSGDAEAPYLLEISDWKELFDSIRGF